MTAAWVLVLVTVGAGALPGVSMTSQTFLTRTACEAALADIQRQLRPAPYLPQPHTAPPQLAGGCYPR